MKDTINMRHNAYYSTKLYKNTKWVPFNILGQTRYTNEEMKNLCINHRNEIYRFLKSPYEVIQYIQLCDFEDCEDINYENRNGNQWQINCHGIEAINLNKGNCTALSALFHFILSKHFTVKSLCFIAHLGIGHVINYIEYNSKIYFFDMYTQILPYINFVAPEDGKLASLSKSKYITGICIETTTIDDFIFLFKRYNILKKRHYTFLTYYTEVCPPVIITENGKGVVVVFPTNTCIQIHEKSDFVDINFLEFS